MRGFRLPLLSADTGGSQPSDAAPPPRAERVLIGRARLLMMSIVGVLAVALVLGATPRRIAQTTDVQAWDVRRGRIVDRDGLLLASDDFRWQIYLDPSRYRSDILNEERLARVADELQVDRSLITEAILRGGSVSQVAPDVSRNQCEAADKSLAVPSWFWCDRLLKRSYPQGPLGAHITGATLYDQQGVYGVEGFYDQWLRSGGDWSPALGEPLSETPELLKWFLPSSNGRDLVLAMAAPLQYKVEASLLNALSASGASTGTVIVMDPKTGDLLALANRPSYDPNVIGEADPSTWPNPAISQFYEPGTLFSLITIASALDAGTISPETTFANDRAVEVAGRSILDAGPDTPKSLTLAQVLNGAHTVPAARIALEMGGEGFYRYVGQFGFGSMTEVDLSYEIQGLVKSWGSASWSLFDEAVNGFGQGLDVTPLQIIDAVAAIANDGMRPQPRAATGLVADGQVYPIRSRTIGQALRAKTARQVVQIMTESARGLEGIDLGTGYTVAGQLGIAEMPTDQGYESPSKVVSFVGFFPAEDPKVIILVKLDKPREAQAQVAVTSLFSTVARDAIAVLNIKPE